MAWVNGEPGLIGYAGDMAVGIAGVEVEGGVIRKIFMVMNPDKLSGIPKA